MLQIKPAIWLSANFLFHFPSGTLEKPTSLWVPHPCGSPLLALLPFSTSSHTCRCSKTKPQESLTTSLKQGFRKKNTHFSPVPFFHESQIFPMLGGIRSGKYSTVLGLQHCGQEPTLILVIGYTRGCKLKGLQSDEAMVDCPSACCKSTSIRIAWIQEKAKPGHTCLCAVQGGRDRQGRELLYQPSQLTCTYTFGRKKKEQTAAGMEKTIILHIALGTGHSELVNQCLSVQPIPSFIAVRKSFMINHFI